MKAGKLMFRIKLYLVIVVDKNPSMKLWTRVVSCRNAVWEMAPDVDGMVRAALVRLHLPRAALGTRAPTI